MKNLRKITLTLLAGFGLLATSLTVNAQEEATESSWDAGFDLYTSYIWRGAKFGSGPAFQPWVSYATGGLEVGSWGSVNASVDEALEMDLYASYSFDFGLGLAVTDYYFGGEWFAFDSTHFFEPAVSFEAGDFSVLGAFMIGPDTEDIYGEIGYTLGSVDLALGVGNGAYTSDGDFMLCNVSIGTSKEIKITEDFSLPLSGGVTLNPSTEGFYIYAGISF